MIFRINKYLELRFENNQTNIYVNGQLFRICKALVINIPKDKIKEFDGIRSIDDVVKYSSKDTPYIPPETEFWGHCSNLQTWAEHDYDPRLLHSNLSFPLLKKLADVGDPKAKYIFKEEIIERIEEGNFITVYSLYNKGNFRYFNLEELQIISDNIIEKIIDSVINNKRNMQNLSSNITFDLLNGLERLGIKKAGHIFIEKLIKRIGDNNPSAIHLLLKNGYFKYFNLENLKTLSKKTIAYLINLIEEKCNNNDLTIDYELLFFLLKKLKELGIVKAKDILKKEIIKKIEKGDYSSLEYVFRKKIFKCFNLEELKNIIEKIILKIINIDDNQGFIKYFYCNYPYRLLKQLIKLGISKAKHVLIEDIIKIIKRGYLFIIQNLFYNNYFDFFDVKDLKIISEEIIKRIIDLKKENYYYEIKNLYSGKEFKILQKLAILGEPKAKNFLRKEITEKIEKGNLLAIHSLIDSRVLKCFDLKELYFMVKKIIERVIEINTEKKNNEISENYDLIFLSLKELTYLITSEAKHDLNGEIKKIIEKLFEKVVNLNFEKNNGNYKIPLDTNLAISILAKLANLGILKAKDLLRKELIRKIEKESPSTIYFLPFDEYLKFFESKESKILLQKIIDRIVNYIDENNDDDVTKSLDDNYIFASLKKLIKLGVPKAKQILKEEITKIIKNGNPTAILNLYNWGYFKYLDLNDLKKILEKVIIKITNFIAENGDRMNYKMILMILNEIFFKYGVNIKKNFINSIIEHLLNENENIYDFIEFCFKKDYFIIDLNKISAEKIIKSEKITKLLIKAIEKKYFITIRYNFNQYAADSIAEGKTYISDLIMKNFEKNYSIINLDKDFRERIIQHSIKGNIFACDFLIKCIEKNIFSKIDKNLCRILVEYIAKNNPRGMNYEIFIFNLIKNNDDEIFNGLDKILIKFALKGSEFSYEFLDLLIYFNFKIDGLEILWKKNLKKLGAHGKYAFKLLKTWIKKGYKIDKVDDIINLALKGNEYAFEILEELINRGYKLKNLKKLWKTSINLIIKKNSIMAINFILFFIKKNYTIKQLKKLLLYFKKGIDSQIPWNYLLFAYAIFNENDKKFKKKFIKYFNKNIITSKNLILDKRNYNFNKNEFCCFNDFL
ncbi:MAG: hypothetical protein ACP6IY_18330 [Promethearchaeia archaeon]